MAGVRVILRGLTALQDGTVVPTGDFGQALMLYPQSPTARLE